jgi:hypothetical protein
VLKLGLPARRRPLLDDFLEALQAALAPRCLVEEAVVLEELKDRALTLCEPCLEVHGRQSSRARGVIERCGKFLELNCEERAPW